MTPQPTSPTPLPPDQLSPRTLLLRIFGLKNVFQRNWKLMLALMVLGGLIGFIVEMNTRRVTKYGANIRFNLGGGGGQNQFGDLGSIASAFGLGQGAPDANIFSGENFQIYATSRPVLEKTLMKTIKIKGRDTLLLNYYIRHSGIREKEWEDSEDYKNFYFPGAKKPEEYTKKEANAMADIIFRLKTLEILVEQPDRKSSFMDLKATTEDEELSESLANAHLETIEEDYRQKQTKKTREMYTLQKRRTDSLAARLSGTEGRLAQNMNQNMQVVDAQAQVVQTRLTRNSQFLTQLYYASLQNLDNMKLSLIRESPLFIIIEPVTRPLNRVLDKPVGTQFGLGLGLLLGIVITFFRETYRSVMRED